MQQDLKQNVAAGEIKFALFHATPDGGKTSLYPAYLFIHYSASSSINSRYFV